MCISSPPCFSLFFTLHSKAVKLTVAAMKAMSITEESCSVLYLTLRLRCAIEGMTGGLGEEGRGRGDFKACFQDRIFCLNPHTGGKKSWYYFCLPRSLSYFNNPIHVHGCL